MRLPAGTVKRRFQDIYPTFKVFIPQQIRHETSLSSIIAAGAPAVTGSKYVYLALCKKNEAFSQSTQTQHTVFVWIRITCD
jgi:hypothetical protein